MPKFVDDARELPLSQAFRYDTNKYSVDCNLIMLGGDESSQIEITDDLATELESARAELEANAQREMSRKDNRIKKVGIEKSYLIENEAELKPELVRDFGAQDMIFEDHIQDDTKVDEAYKLIGIEDTPVQVAVLDPKFVEDNNIESDHTYFTDQGNGERSFYVLPEASAENMAHVVKDVEMGCTEYCEDCRDMQDTVNKALRRHKK